jgi:predicted MPP superfamily phosphohydrolase
MPSKRTFQFISAALSGLAAIAAGTWYYATRVEPGWLRVTSLSLVLPRLHPAFDNYRIIHISDIHLGTWINRQRLATIVDYINHLHGDLIAITGDFVTDIYHNTPIDLTDTLSALDAPDGVFAVLGNHDYWSDVTTIRQILRPAASPNFATAFTPCGATGERCTSQGLTTTGRTKPACGMFSPNSPRRERQSCWRTSRTTP